MMVIVGRSSSHFTRLARIFAREVGVAYRFQAILDITATDVAVFGGNPALKMPVLVDDDDEAGEGAGEGAGALFGCENICRELVRRGNRAPESVVLRGQVRERVVANFEELTLDAMSAEVSLIFAKINKTEPSARVVKSVTGSLAWLDAHVDEMVATLPSDRLLSFVEAALFCLVTHLPFREVMSVDPYPRLLAHARRFGERESARATEYRFDAA